MEKPKRRTYPPGALCAVEGCGQPRRKLEWCASHYSQWKRLGTVKPFGYKWGSKGVPCVVCGGPVPEGIGRRQHCSGRCQVMASRRHRGEFSVDAVACIDCGAFVDISTKPGERKIRSDRRRCAECRSTKRHRLANGTRVSIGFLKKLGDSCALCDGPVNFSLHAPHPDSPSIDHRIPIGLGGTDEDGLQLAHLRCNQIKHMRLVEKVSRG